VFGSRQQYSLKKKNLSEIVSYLQNCDKNGHAEDVCWIEEIHLVFVSGPSLEESLDFWPFLGRWPLSKLEGKQKNMLNFFGGLSSMVKNKQKMC
jgi:hypothetical protein